MEEFDLPRVRAMTKYWESHPPLHMMVAAYFDIKPKLETDSDNQYQDFGELMSLGTFEENASWIPKA